MKSGKDSLYANPLGEISAFKFDEAVVDVFPDMVQRSVPGYATIISAIGLLAGRFSQESSHCYDLGCSLGAVSLAMRREIKVKDCRIVAIDSSLAMVRKLKQSLAASDEAVPLDVFFGDIRAMEIINASVVVLNFTLQFIPVEDREKLLTTIYKGLLPGGILVISEKLAFENDRQQVLQTDMHHLFKKAQGYSDLEVSQKRSALENVLIPETFSTHQKRLISAGFNNLEVWFQYFNFASMVALK